MRRLLISLTLMILFVILRLPAYADDAITVTANKFTNQFPRQLVFEMESQSRAKITDVALFVQADGQPSGLRQIPDFASDTKIQAKYQWNLSRNYLPPGATGQYWWTVRDSAGDELQTPKQSFRVEDISQTWKKLSNDPLVLFWYSGGESFGKALLERALEAMKFLQQDTGVKVDQPIQIWIYGNRNDFFRALEPGAKEWTGGRAFPEHGIILINVETSRLEWGKEATAHEMTHLIIHQKISSPLGGLSMPHWMDEGLATYYERPPGTLSHEFSAPLKRAIDTDTLVPIKTLALLFPTDSSAANLAYAESWGVVDFIFRHYGREKMAQLLQAFKTGGHYDDIFLQVLGVDTDGLEAEWRKDIGAKSRNIPARSNATPTVVPTLGLSTDFSAAPSTPTPQAVAVKVTPVPTPENSSTDASNKNPALPSNTFCGGAAGLIALGIFGAAKIARRNTARL